MTIGIAAHGPNAGLAVMRALAAVEVVGRGAIGGFVSFVALTVDGRVERRSVQRGGSSALFKQGLQAMPSALAEAPNAGVMSSGPYRPEPLKQFTPAIAGVGLVTGHRMPNTIGVSGININDEVAELLSLGLSPEEAVHRVVDANPDADAGVIALSADGRIHAANTAYVARRGDAGQEIIRTGRISVAVLHNAIIPHQPLAGLAAHVALDVMEPQDRPDGWITFRQGTRLTAGAANAVSVNGGLVDLFTVDNPKFLEGRWSLGIGYNTHVVAQNEPFAIMLYEPYMVVENGRLHTIDGLKMLSVPIRLVPKPNTG